MMSQISVSATTRTARLIKTAKSFLADRSGVTAIEYGLIAALVAVAIIGGLNSLSGSLSNTFTNVSASLNSATSSNK